VLRACLAAACVTLAACSSVKPYPESSDKNLQVRTDATKVRASLEIYRLDDQCRMLYEGTVALDQPVVAIKVPPERASILVLTFSSSSFLGGSRGAMTRQTLLRPKTGHRYEIEARYKDDIYDIGLNEITQDGAVRRLELSTQGACRSG
jgi:hypothetical protein